MPIPEDSAVYLAERLRRDYDIEGPAERPHFVSIAADRGIRYVIDESLPRAGSCFILRRDGRAACIISGQARRLDEAHEVCHGVTERLTEDGVEFPDLAAQDPEHVIWRMAKVLAGPEPPQEPSEALRGFVIRPIEPAVVPVYSPPPPPVQSPKSKVQSPIRIRILRRPCGWFLFDLARRRTLRGKPAPPPDPELPDWFAYIKTAGW